MFIKHNAITIFAYLSVSWLVLNLMHEPYQALLIWPAVGTGITCALVWGYQVLPALYISQFVLSVLLYNNPEQAYTFDAFIITNMFIIADLFRCYFGAFIIKFFVGYPNAYVSFQSILKFFLIAAPLTTFISAIGFSLVKWYLGYLENIDYLSNFLNWWSGDLLGLMIFAPLTMVFIAQPKSIWRPRYLTVGIPVIITFLGVILIYNKTQINDSDRIIGNLKIKTEILSTKLSQYNTWIDNIIDNSLFHLSNSNDSQQQLNKFIQQALDVYHSVEAIIRIDSSGTKTFIHSKDPARQRLIKSLDIDKFTAYSLSNNETTSKYSNQLQRLISSYKFENRTYSASLIIIHDFRPYLDSLIKRYELSNINFYLNLNNATDRISLVKTSNLLPRTPTNVQSTLSFHNEKWNLILEPSLDYFITKQSLLLSLIAKLGFIFTALLAAMLLVITGKTALTNIQVQERTLDLDQQATNFKKRKKEYQDLIEQHPVILWRQNMVDKKMSYISSKVEGLFGYPLSRWLNEEDFWMKKIHLDDTERVISTINKYLKDNKPFELEYRFIKNDYSVAWIKDVININKDSQLNIQLVGLMSDVTETFQAKEKQHISESKYRTLFKHASNALAIIDLDDNSFKDANDKCIELFGLNLIRGDYSLGDFSPIKQPDGSNSNKRLRSIYRSVIKTETIQFEWVMLDKNHKHVLCDIELVTLPKQENNLLLASINDITEKKLHEKRINQLAYYDNLTKLPNREYFYSKFEYFHKYALDTNKYGTIIYLDLDRFKLLNDSLGHQAGDELLKMVASRIKKVTKKNDFIARLGGDEFIILTKGLNKSIESTLETSLIKSELILEALNDPYQLGDYEHYITPSIGISLFPDKEYSLDQIVHQADIAMYTSKEKGKNTITIYQESMVKFVGERLRVEKAIRQAFDQQEFELYYQPQYNDNNEIQAVEALLRWSKLDELHLDTEKLIDLIEQIGLIHDLGYWVFDQVCIDLQNWQSQNHDVTCVAINISAKQFHQKLFIDQIKSVISSYEINPAQIAIELTEAVIIEDVDSLIPKLDRLQKYGIKISLDDFGTGYSSLAYLKHLPIDQLKIDKMFINDLTKDKSSQHIVKTVIELSKLMGLELVAEGIETNEQFELLKQLGCQIFQGYYFSEPITAKQLFS